MGDSSDSGHSSCPGSPVIGQVDHGRRRTARASASAADCDHCPGRVPLLGGTVRHPFSAQNSTKARLSQTSAVRHLLLSVAQAADMLECATVAPEGRGGDGQHYKLRLHASRKMRSLHDYIERCGARMDPTWREAAEKGLHCLHRHIGHLPSPPPLTDGPPPAQPGRQSPGHHLFHLHLELRLLAVSALALLRSPDSAEQPWRRAAQTLLWDLAALVHSRRSQLAASELHRRAALGCGCEKGVWLALRRLLDTGSCRPRPASAGGQQQPGLWPQLDLLFDSIQQAQTAAGQSAVQSEPQSNQDELEDVVFGPREVRWTEVPLLLVWMLCAISDVYRYDHNDVYQPDALCAGNTEQLLALLTAAQLAKTADDGRVAALLALCGQLARLWGAPAPLTLRLWQVMGQRLLRPQTAVSVPRLAALLPGSGREWLDSVLRPPATAEDSFSQYLRQLPALLAGADSWRQLRGRVLLKLHPRLATQLAPPQLAAACALFLSLLHTVDDLQLLSKYVSFLSLAAEQRAQQVLVCRAYFAAVHLLLERGLDVSEVALPAAAQADREMRAAAERGATAHPLLAAYLRECDHVFRRSAALDRSEYLLITAAWRQYLSSCGPAEQTRALALLLPLSQKLLTLHRQLQPLLHVVDTEVVTRREQQAQLQERLRQLVPWLQAGARVASPPAELAPLAAALTLLPATDCQLQHCTAAAVSSTFCAAYVYQLLLLGCAELEDDADALAALWLRCTAGGADAASLALLTAEVARRCPLVPSDAGSPRQAAAQLVSRLQGLSQQGPPGCERVNRVVSGLEFIEPCLRAARSPAVTSQLYHVMGLVVQRLTPALEHRKLVYLVNKLLLPTTVYDPEKPLPPPVQAALHRCLPLYLSGISTADYEGHPFYRRCVRDTVVNYIYRFADGTHPLLECLQSDVAPKFRGFVIDLMTELFLRKINGKHHPNMIPALQLLGELAAGKQRLQVAQHALSPVLELLLIVEDPSAKRAGTDVLKALVQTDCEPGRAALSSALQRLVERHLGFAAARLFRLLEVVAVLAPSAGRALLPVLQAQVTRVEQRRGLGQDRSLRAGLQQVQRRLGA